MSFKKHRRRIYSNVWHQNSQTETAGILLAVNGQVELDVQLLGTFMGKVC